MALKDDIQLDLLDIEADLCNPVFTWDGEDYICIPSTVERMLESSTDFGNFKVQRHVILTVRTNLFSDGVFPESQDVIKFDGAYYRIGNVKKDITGAFLKLECGPTTK